MTLECEIPTSCARLNQNFVLLHTVLGTAEREVKTVVRRMHFSDGQTAFVLGATNVQSLSVDIRAAADCPLRNMTARAAHPLKSRAAKNLRRKRSAARLLNRSSPTHFELLLSDLVSAVRYVGNVLCWEHFGRQHVAFVRAAANVNWRAVNIVSSRHRIGRGTRARVRMHPSVTFKTFFGRKYIFLSIARWQNTKKHFNKLIVYQMKVWFRVM